MRQRIHMFFLRLLFGESGVSGFYIPPADGKCPPKKYLCEALFPDQKTLEEALQQSRRTMKGA